MIWEKDLIVWRVAAEAEINDLAIYYLDHSSNFACGSYTFEASWIYPVSFQALSRIHANNILHCKLERSPFTYLIESRTWWTCSRI